MKKKDLHKQVGGSHYKHFKIQPIEYIIANDLLFPEACVVKYVSRHIYKNGKEDILKAIQNLEFILQRDYSNWQKRLFMTYIRYKNGNANFTYIEKFDDAEKAADPSNEGTLVEVKINDVKIEFTRVKKEDDTIKKSSAKVERSSGEKTSEVSWDKKKDGEVSVR